MYFQVTFKEKNYDIEVQELRHHWYVSLHPQGGTKESHKIPKSDYKQMDDAISMIFNKSSYMIDVVADGLDFQVFTRGSYQSMTVINEERLLHESLKGAGQLGTGDTLVAGMPGKIVDIMVAVGDVVKAKQSVLIMEAMKMENEMRATQEAVVKEILVTKGQSVDTGAVLIVFEKV